MCKNTANIIKFPYIPNSEKINGYIFQEIQKTLFLAHFGPIFTIIGAKKIVQENPALSHATSYGFLAPCQNLEKVSDTIQRKCPDRRKDRRTDGRMDGRTEGQTLFYRTLPATAGGPIINSNKSGFFNMSLLLTLYL